MPKKLQLFCSSGADCCISAGMLAPASAEFFGCNDAHSKRSPSAATATPKNSPRRPCARASPCTRAAAIRGRNAKRYCRSWLAKEYRVSGPVIVPQMHCVVALGLAQRNFSAIIQGWGHRRCIDVETRKFFAIAALIAGAFAMTPGPALAQHHHGGGGHWHWRRPLARRWLGWRLGLVWTRALLGAGAGGYPYYDEPYYAEPDLRLGARARLAARPLGPAPRLALLVNALHVKQ